MNTVESNIGEKALEKASLFTAKETPLEEKIKIVRELFPAEHKETMLASASRDTRGRTVRYFRVTTYKDIERLLTLGETTASENSSNDEIFEKKKIQIKSSLARFLEELKLKEKFAKDFQELSENFTLKNYQQFIQTKLSRLDLFRLQISMHGGGMYGGITGLTSCSVGGPLLTPKEPIPREGYEGLPVIEMVIPDEEVLVHPLFKTLNIEMEKEVNTKRLKVEWITDIYLSEKDFIERFVADERVPLHSFHDRSTYMTDGLPRMSWSAFDTLQDWKRSESIADLIPVSKLKDIDENNPILQKPLVI
ncbi:MAG: hypothetical protein Q8P07_00635 [bacterium]|nr:hypothetical protein [bacterium]